MKIEKNIPLPPMQSGRETPKGELRLLMEQWQRGDSILLDDKKQLGVASSAAKKLGQGIASRKQPDGKIRIWYVGPYKPRPAKPGPITDGNA